MRREPFVHILASRRHGTLYIGVTSDLLGRMYRHRTGATPGFALKYKAFRLVHFEQVADMDSAIAREKQLKNWRRAWKIALIEQDNPDWKDKAIELGFDPVAPHPSTLRRSSSRGHEHRRMNEQQNCFQLMPGSTWHP